MINQSELLDVPSCGVYRRPGRSPPLSCIGDFSTDLPGLVQGFSERSLLVKTLNDSAYTGARISRRFSESVTDEDQET